MKIFFRFFKCLPFLKHKKGKNYLRNFKKGRFCIVEWSQMNSKFVLADLGDWDRKMTWKP